jgi:hypothetical protein
MGYNFTSLDLTEISKTLNAEFKEFSNGWTININNPKMKQALVLTIYNNVELGSDEIGSLISVQTQHGYFELHNCTNFLVFEPDEVIFILKNSDKVSSLILSKDGACSMYANIEQAIINADFSELDPAVLLAAMQLSLTETIAV